MTNSQFLRCLGFLLMTGASLIWMANHTGVDLWLADAMYDQTSRQFPWRDTWFASVFVHHWVKVLLIFAGLLCIAILLGDLSRRFHQRGPALDLETRRKLTVVVLSSLLVPLTITVLKAISHPHCPWDIDRYGGFAPHLALFDALPAGVKAGHCFPAGHASSGLWLAAFAVFFLPRWPWRAAAVFVAGLLPGLALGWVQQMRGAHFLSHTLASAWLTALILLLLTRICLYETPTTADADSRRTSLAR